MEKRSLSKGCHRPLACVNVLGMCLRTGILLLTMLLLGGCSGASLNPSGTAAPPPGPAGASAIRLKLRLPELEARSNRGEILQVVVELTDRNTPDPSSLSGRRVVASGAAGVEPGAREVLVLIPVVPPGDWDVQAFGRDSQGVVVAASDPTPLTIGFEALVITLQLVQGGAPIIQSLTLAPLAPSIAVGTTQAFQATDESGQSVTGQVSWSSSDPAVASIDATGLASGLAPGTTTITASRNGVLATTSLTVTAATLTSLAITPLTPSVPAGLTQQFSATGTFSDNSTQDLTGQVTWSSSAGAVASIDAVGLATTLTPGVTDIGATLNGVSAQTTLTVTAAILQSLAVTPLDPSLFSSGRARQFTATGTFSDGSVVDVTEQVSWTSSNPAVASVSDVAGTRGQMRTSGVGTITIQALVGAVGASTNVTITSDPLVRLLGEQNFPVGQGAQAMTTGDFNADGILDIATGNVNANTVSVLLGNGDGTFQPAQDFPTQVFPDGVNAGDFNGDGRLDLIASNSNSDSVSVLLGNGNGTFQTAVNSTTGFGSNPNGVALGDVNGDGRLDAVTGNFNLDQAAVLLGNGDGTFLAPLPVGVGNAPDAIELLDLNGDGLLDLATSDFGGDEVSTALGNGDGTFQPAQSFGIANAPDDLAFGDFNGDGLLDLVTANGSTDDGSVFIGNGDGTMQPAATLVLPAGSQPFAVAVGDINADGRLDLAFCNLSLDSASILLGNGDGTFQAPQNFAIGSGPAAVGLADLNGDGCLDLFTANLGFPDDVAVRLQDPVSP